MFRGVRINSSNIHKSVPFAVTAAVFGSKNELFCKCKQEQNKNDDDHKDEHEMFFDYFPLKQLYKPEKPYPAWDNNWDSKEKEFCYNCSEGSKGSVTTRHLILIRHGQYDETFKDDARRHLTALGREQAHLTGKRLAELIEGIDEKFEPCNVKVIRVSDMTRAKETASIISEYLPKGVIRANPDPLLNEGIPAQIIPKRPELSIEEDLAKNGPRIEKAFIKYFYRHTDKSSSNATKGWLEYFFRHEKETDTAITKANKNVHKHEFDIIVCHGNVIRYFFCRALQLPPEAWLRMSIFNCSLTYLMIMPNGRVSCRMLGDIGHLDYGHSTFSMNHGFVW